MKQTGQKGNAAVSWFPSPHHPYEDSSSLLTKDLPLVLEIDDIGVAAEELTTQARNCGSSDDITVVLAEIEFE